MICKKLCHFKRTLPMYVLSSLPCSATLIVMQIVRYVDYPESDWGKSSDDRALSWADWIKIEENNR